jgi:hypothetical protein
MTFWRVVAIFIKYASERPSQRLYPKSFPAVQKTKYS